MVMDYLGLLIVVIGGVVFTILTQDIHIFPGAFFPKFRIWDRGKKAPYPVESSFIKTVDGKALELWRHPNEEETDLSKYIGIVCHGNGSTLEDFLFYQMWLSELGIRSYNFDYRGFGRSEGWPSEKGIYKDSEAVWEHVLMTEGVDASQIIVVGVSIGSGPAARLARTYQPPLLILSSAFIDLKSVVRSQSIIGWLAPFVRHSFPTIEYVRELKTTHVLLAHGLNDTIVPPEHSNMLEGAYTGSGHVRRCVSAEGGHNMAFFDLKNELKEIVKKWL